MATRSSSDSEVLCSACQQVATQYLAWISARQQLLCLQATFLLQGTGKIFPLDLKVFWIFMRGTQLQIYRRFEGTYCVHLQGEGLRRGKKLKVH
jgi:hypothetical protein